MTLIDLSQTIINRMQVYPGDDPPMLHQTHNLEFDGHTNFQLTIGMHSGTHVDGPFHMIDDYRMISDMPLESFIGKGCVIDISDTKEFDDSVLTRIKASGYSAVLFYTGWSKYFGTSQYLKGYPLISENVAQAIADMEIKLVGIDTLSPDNSPNNTHDILLGNGIVIAENLTNLNKLMDVKEFTVIALPLKIKADSAPARVVAMY
jgi:kynurenine formamidase